MAAYIKVWWLDKPILRSSRIARHQPAHAVSVKLMENPSLTDLQTRAMFLLWITAKLSYHELAALASEHIEARDEDGLIIRIPSQSEKEEQRILVRYGTTHTACPVRSLDGWMSQYRGSGYVFRLPPDDDSDRTAWQGSSPMSPDDVHFFILEAADRAFPDGNFLDRYYERPIREHRMILS